MENTVKIMREMLKVEFEDGLAKLFLKEEPEWSSDAPQVVKDSWSEVQGIARKHLRGEELTDMEVLCITVVYQECELGRIKAERLSDTIGLLKKLIGKTEDRPN
jgi:hypothetical protein